MRLIPVILADGSGKFLRVELPDVPRVGDWMVVGEEIARVTEVYWHPRKVERRAWVEVWFELGTVDSSDWTDDLSGLVDDA